VAARLTAVAAALLAGLAACSPGAAAPSPGGPVGLPSLASPSTYRPAAAPHRGGSITVGTWQFPTAFSPYFSPQAAATPIQNAILDGLLGTDPTQQWYGDLAADVPTVENGGVRPVGAGMDVTYQLRQGLLWSDGQPLTSDDVLFTFQTITGPAAAAGFGQDGYERISSVEPRGERALVVHFRSIYPAYRGLFPAVLPRHRLGQVNASQLSQDGYWRKPDVVSGPFTLAQVGDDRLTLARNAQYGQGRQGMAFLGHPAYADRVVFKAYPTRQALLAAVKAGDVQVAGDLSERELPTIARLTDVRVALASALQYEQVSFNQGTVDPSVGGTPPWSGDPAVLQALDLALDRPGLEAGPLHDRSPLTGSPVSPLLGWAYASDVATPSYDLAAAKELLDADGWMVGADGVRTKNGRRLAFMLTSTEDQLLRMNEEEIMAAGWRKLGAAVSTQNYSSQEIFADFVHGGVLARGLYQAAIWAWITPPDPDTEFDTLNSSRMPAAGAMSNQNYSRCRSGAVDQALSQGRATLDEAQRGSAYRAFQHAYAQARCEMPLYRRLAIGVTSPRLRNFVLNPGLGGSTWNLADWWLA
jgi:peptide/nickel transport system substrate-binding protein